MTVVRLTYIEADGAETIVEARPGQSLMEAAVKNGVRGIAADCGGNAACGTCRIYPTETWRDRLGDIRRNERDMLEFTEDTAPGVRLACQIQISEDLDGLVVHLPASQH
jgi:2Fe-2S ferredoxin